MAASNVRALRRGARTDAACAPWSTAFAAGLMAFAAGVGDRTSTESFVHATAATVNATAASAPTRSLV